MEPLEQIIAETREAVAKTYAAREPDPPPNTEEERFNRNLRAMQRCESFAGMSDAISQFIELYNVGGRRGRRRT